MLSLLYKLQYFSNLHLYLKFLHLASSNLSVHLLPEISFLRLARFKSTAVVHRVLCGGRSLEMSKFRKSLNLFVLVPLVLLVVFVKYATSTLARINMKTNQNLTDRLSVQFLK